MLKGSIEEMCRLQGAGVFFLTHPSKEVYLKELSLDLKISLLRA